MPVLLWFYSHLGGWAVFVVGLRGGGGGWWRGWGGGGLVNSSLPNVTCKTQQPLSFQPRGFLRLLRESAVRVK